MKVLTLVFLIFGCFLGAGFVSGKEIATYFSKFGKFSPVAIIFAGILLFLLIYFFLRLSNKTNSFSKFILFYFGKYGLIINILFAICLFILTSSMLAGSITIAKVLNINHVILAFLTIIICYISVIGNENCLSKINLILMPAILVIMLIVCGMDFNFQGFDGNIFLSIISSGNYVLINIVTLGLFILEIGYKYTNKQKLLAALFSSIIICFFMFICNSAIINNNLLNASMPILELAQSKSLILSIITAIVVWCGLITTIISCVFLLANYLNNYINNYKITVALILISALICSNFGFDFMVNYIYSIIGLIGLFLVICILCKERETFVVKVSRKR